MEKTEVCLENLVVKIVDSQPYSLIAEYSDVTFNERGRRLKESPHYFTEYVFKEVTSKELLRLRLDGKPGVVYKFRENLYYTEVPGDLRINRVDESTGTHLCGKNCSKVCNGCTRVLDLTESFQLRMGKEFPYSVLDSWRVEKYDYLKEALEAFNMDQQNDACMVYDCANYEMVEHSFPRGRPSAELKIGLASMYWEDFNGDLREMRHRINANKTSDY